jgi:predicted phosphodiesterase
MKILLISDLHLNKPRGELKRFGTIDAEIALASLKSLAEQQLYDAAIIAGDVFNGVDRNSDEIHLVKNDYGDISLEQALSSIPQDKIYCITGNHDRGTYNSISDMLGYRYLYRNGTYMSYEIGEGITVCGCDYVNTETHRAFLSEKRADIMVCHMPMIPFASFGDNQVSVKDCPEDCVVVVGDTHKPDVYCSDNRLVISPGCLFPADKTELTSGCAGSAYTLKISKNNGELSIDGLDNHSLETRFGCVLSSISTSDELSGVIKAIRDSGRVSGQLKPVLYIPESVPVPDVDDFEIIKLSETSEDVATEVEVAGLDDTDLYGKIDKIMSKMLEGNIDSEKVSELTRDLIMSDDPSQVIQNFVNNFKHVDNSTETAI